LHFIIVMILCCIFPLMYDVWFINLFFQPNQLQALKCTIALQKKQQKEKERVKMHQFWNWNWRWALLIFSGEYIIEMWTDFGLSCSQNLTRYLGIPPKEKLLEKFMKCQFHLRSTLLPLTHICNFVATDWLALLLLAKSLRLPFSFQLEHYFNVSVCLFICLSPNHPLNTHPLTHSAPSALEFPALLLVSLANSEECGQEEFAKCSEPLDMLHLSSNFSIGPAKKEELDKLCQ